MSRNFTVFKCYICLISFFFFIFLHLKPGLNFKMAIEIYKKIDKIVDTVKQFHPVEQYLETGPDNIQPEDIEPGDTEPEKQT